jgi:hypothetical protein
MAFLENLAEGFAQAAGSTGTVNRIEKQKSDRQANSQEELHGRTQMILNDVQGVQQKIAAIDPNDPTAAQKRAQYQKELGSLQQVFTDLYHPVKNPGALQQLGGILNRIRGKQPPQAPSGPSMTERMAQGNVAGAGVSEQAQPQPDKMAEVKKAYKATFGVDMPEEQAQKFFSHLYGGAPLEPKAVKYSDYASGLRRFVQAEGGDPDNPTAAQEEAFRQQRLKDAAGARATDTTRETTQTDPFGLKTTTSSVLHRRAASPVVAPIATPTGTKTPGQMKKDLEGKVSKHEAKPQLDAQGHIPSTAKVNPYLREAANNVLDGMAVKDLSIPAKDKAAVEQLATQYGWKGQGLFSPKDQLLVRESTGILNQLAKSDSLSVLDDTASRLKLSQVLQNPEKRGMIGQTVQTLAAANLSPAEQQFVTLYNQAVGRISGLSQLVRSGRATEAQIERLKSELPNPATTSSSEHARQKLAQIQNEIDIALQKGQFVESPASSDQKNISDDEFLMKVK